MMYRYSLRYRRDNAPLERVFRLTVSAADADEARVKAKASDPHFLYTIASPQRRAMLEPVR